VLRAALAPALAWAILRGHEHMALAVLLLAAITDYLDGWVARRLQVESALGAYLDPIADKLLLVTLYFCEGLAGYLPAWLVAMVFGRDLMILAFAAWALLFTRLRSFPPSVWGKISTGAQIATGLAVLADPSARLDRGLVLATAAVPTAWSGLHYMWRGIGMLRDLAANSLGPPIDGGVKRG
jgi:cardiolipin synthase